MRKWVSDTGWRGRMRNTFSAAMFMPPVKPTQPSSTRIFLWVRRLMNGMRQGSVECMKRATGTPLRCSSLAAPLAK